MELALADSIGRGDYFFTGMVFYLQTTRAKNSRGKWGFWLMILLLIVGHIAGVLSPPPATVTAIGWGTQALWLYVLLGFWVDHNRVTIQN